MTRGPDTCSSRGFTLLEAVVALLLLTTTMAGAAALAGMSRSAAMEARLQTSMAALAVEKIEQLRSLPWAFEGGTAVSDIWTNLSVTPPRSDGVGLAPSPLGSLGRDTPGHVDYLDRHGAWLAGGGTPPPGAVFVRRWSVQPLADDPVHTVVLRVLVTTTARSRQAGFAVDGALPRQVLMTTLLTRKVR